MPYFRSGSIETYYQEFGQGEPLLLLHGLGSSSQDWAYQIPALSANYRMICPDLRGHGRSEKAPGPYNMAIFAADIADLLGAVASGGVHVLGVSLGGMVAFQLALDHPDLVRSMILVNTTPELVPKNLKDRLVFWQRNLIVRFLGLRKMGQILAERFFLGEEMAELRDEFADRWATNHKPSYLAALRAAFGWTVKGHLGQINCPTLVIASDEDYFSLMEKQEYVRLIPEARLAVVEDARHALPAEKPDIFNQLVLDYLDSI